MEEEREEGSLQTAADVVKDGVQTVADNLEKLGIVAGEKIEEAKAVVRDWLSDFLKPKA